MSVTTGIAAANAAKDAGISIYTAAQSIISNMDSNTTLGGAIKKCVMLHRVYVQKEVAGEEAVYDILVNVQNMIAAWALCALQLEANVSASKTVRKFLDVVATESLGRTSKTFTTLERLLDKYPGIIYGTEAQASQSNNAPRPKDPIKVSGTTSDLKEDFDNRLPGGKIIDVDISMGNSEKLNQVTRTISIWLQLLPTLIPENIMEQFVALNFKPTFMQRWIQLTTGEISFVKDFLFAADQRKARLNAKKKDKNGVLDSMLNKNESSIRTWFSKLASSAVGQSNNRQNIATAVLVYDRYSFEKICKKHNCNFARPNDRARFFHGTMSMMVIVVDSMYGTVDFYIAGLDVKATYSFAQMKNNAKSDKFSLVDIMQAMSRNQAPKF
jgi:hypothetical protein